jgi:hypothetical protein
MKKLLCLLLSLTLVGCTSSKGKSRERAQKKNSVVVLNEEGKKVIDSSSKQETVNVKADAFGNKRLSSSSSIRSLKNAKNEHQHENASSIFPGMDSIFNPNLSKDSLKNHEKNLPFINISLNKKNIQNFRNNFSFVNKSHKKNFLNGNGYFSEKIKDNDMVKIKGSINGNYH